MIGLMVSNSEPSEFIEGLVIEVVSGASDRRKARDSHVPR
jgi:hypothetical protein